MSTSNASHGQGDDSGARGGSLRLGLTLAALGVVYGDIGTSPIYAIRECFHGDFAIAVTDANVLGILSLVFWSLTLVVSIKYLGLVLRADNNGEGGALALTALLMGKRTAGNGRKMLAAAGLFAASLLYGDGMITPAISVLSAIEGIGTVTPSFDPWVIPTVVIILAALFMLQPRGTGRVGMMFGPIIMVWFITLACLGISGIAHQPAVLWAFNPAYAVGFLLTNRLAGFLVLGAVFLVVTGAEALYADMGHFGKGPIRLAWFSLVFPALLLNYFGQGALLLENPALADRPFYALAPEWFSVPLVALATVATIIASQAVISGAFSITNQAIQLGLCPRMRVVHTSSETIGQIYIPFINWLLMASTIGLVLGFRSSSRLAAAYGVAVTTTMLVTTLLFYAVARDRWGWRRPLALAPTLIFLVVDLSFFGANISKIVHGAWFPLVIGGIAYLLLSTWKSGRQALWAAKAEVEPSTKEFLQQVREAAGRRVPGQAVFMTSDANQIPSALRLSLAHLKVLHEEVALLTVEIEDVPRVPREEKVEVDDLGGGFHRVQAHFGFMEEPSVPYALALARERGLDIDLEEASFFLGRERPVRGRGAKMSAWRGRLFAFLLRNAMGATTYYRIPPNQVIEIGSQVRV